MLDIAGPVFNLKAWRVNEAARIQNSGFDEARGRCGVRVPEIQQMPKHRPLAVLRNMSCCGRCATNMSEFDSSHRTSHESFKAKETKLLQTIDKLKIKAMRLPCHCNIFCLVFFDMFSLTTDSHGIRIEHICA